MSSINISCLQFDIAWEEKAINKKRIADMLPGIPANTDIVVLPEMFTTGFSMNPVPFAEKMTGPTVGWMLELSREMNAVITGSLMISEFGQYRNRLLWIKPDGSISFYDKRHPFCLIEEGKYFQKGFSRGLFSYKDWTFMPSVCYDLRFPVWLRNDLDYDVLLNVANWPSIRSFAWKQMGSVRALENQSYVVLVNRVGKDNAGMNFTGDSRIISFDGKSLIEATADKTQIISAALSKKTLDDYRKKYPFHKDRDIFKIST
jgi:predicted amidohydrolase